MPDSILLIGPWRAGKSTLGRLLAHALGIPFCDLPTKAADYWRPAGYDPEAFRCISQEEGIEAALRYVEPFEVATLERGLQDHSGSVIEVGPLQVVQERPELARRVQSALAAFQNV